MKGSDFALLVSEAKLTDTFEKYSAKYGGNHIFNEEPEGSEGLNSLQEREGLLPEIYRKSARHSD